MKVLHNRFSNKELKRLMLEEKEPRVTISFYKYFHLDDPQQFRDELYIKFYEIDVFGRVYIASEGINGQISVPESKKNTFKEILYNAHPQLNGIRLNEALDNDGKSFWVLRMKVRKKIVADGIDDQTFDPSKTGKYLTAKEFNKLSDQADTIVVDMRNSYEYEVGHFNNAIEIP
ncbi:MAG: rhodanese-related sulfurtransferase, partial [Fermentimonas sp.]|nr:rhodanese-related sulfurtransferase [Fermentimonas sp.]